MPCEVTEGEKEYYLALELLEFVEEKTGQKRRHEDPTQALCDILGRRLPKFKVDDLVYNARNRTSRRLADWWEDHQEKDKETQK